MSDYLYFVVFPYIAVTTFVVGCTYRFLNDKYSLSSHSSEFLGNKRSLLIGSWLFHWGIILVLTMHFIGMFIPSLFKLLINDDNRIYWERTGWVISGLLVIGLSLLFLRRLLNPRLRAVTTLMDWIIITEILIQVSLGLYIAFTEYPGSQWYIDAVVPWLNSLVLFDPSYGTIAGMKLLIRLHILNGLLIITLFPFTRLMHLFSYPYYYAWRKFQLVIWDRNKPVENPNISLDQQGG